MLNFIIVSLNVCRHPTTIGLQAAKLLASNLIETVSKVLSSHLDPFVCFEYSFSLLPQYQNCSCTDLLFFGLAWVQASFYSYILLMSIETHWYLLIFQMLQESLCLKLYKPTNVSSVRLHFLSKWCITIWNYLSEETRSSTSASAF